MKKKLFVPVLACLVLILAACGSQTSGGGNSLEQLQESGTVTIGFANEAPYAYQEDGELKGAAVDIARAVFQELGVENMEAQLSDFSQLIPGLQANQFDVVTAGMAIQPARCENAAFSEPTMQYGEGLVVQAGNPLGLESYQDIAANPDATVVVMSGATEIEFLEQAGVSPEQIQTAPDIPATFSAVQSGRADATTATEMTLRMSMESAGSNLEFVENFEQPDVEGVPSYGAAAFNLNNTELRDAYNEALNSLKEDGTVAEILDANGFSAESNMVEVGEVTAEQACNGEV